MPIYNYKCNKCGVVGEYIIGATVGVEPPTDCPECGAKESMEKLLSMNGISSDVIGGYDYEYGKKAWKKNKSAAEKAAIIAGDKDPY